MRNTFGFGALLLLVMVFVTAHGELGGIVSAEWGGGTGGTHEHAAGDGQLPITRGRRGP
jgi:hypothetical protein